jgi:branched-chain amino acid transport system permease protein
MDSIFVYGFTAAVIGGLDSPAGAVAGGLILGVGLSYVGGYVGGGRGSDLTAIVAMAMLVLVLMLRPAGIFSGDRLRQV